MDDFEFEVAAAALLDTVGVERDTAADAGEIPGAVDGYLASVDVATSSDAGPLIASVVTSLTGADRFGDDEARLTEDLRRTWDGLYTSPLPAPERRAVRAVVSVALARRRPVRAAVAVAPLSVEHTWLLTLYSAPERAKADACRSERLTSWGLAQGLLVSAPQVVDGQTVLGVQPTALGMEVARVTAERAVERVIKASYEQTKPGAAGPSMGR